MKSSYLLIVIFVVQLLAVILIWNYIVFPLEFGPNKEVESLKYELFRDVLMAFLAFATIVGSAIYLVLNKVIEARVKELNKVVEEGAKESIEEAKSLVFAKQNFFWCTQKEEEKRQEIKEMLLEHREVDSESLIWLDELVARARKALNFAAQLDERTYEIGICVAKNNLAYYLALRRSPSEREEAKELMDGVREKLGKYDGWYHWLDTYIWVLWRFAENEQDKQKARNVFHELYGKRDIIPDRKFKQKLEDYKPFFIG